MCGVCIHIQLPYMVINIQGSKHMWKTHPHTTTKHSDYIQLLSTVINIQLPYTAIDIQLPYTVIAIKLPHTVINVQLYGNYHVPHGSYMVGTQELYGAHMNVPSTCEQLPHVSILEHVRFPCKIPI